MPLITRLVLKVPNLPWLNTRRAEQIAEAVFLPAADEAGLLAWREIHQRTPVGATAVLRGSIQQATEVLRGTQLTILNRVQTAQPYARPVEEGTRPGVWRPIGPLKLWARRVLGDERAAYRVRWAIYRRGTRPRWFWRDGVAAAMPRIEAIYARARGEFVRRLRGGG